MDRWKDIAIKELGAKRVLIEWEPIVDRSLLNHILTLQKVLINKFGPRLVTLVKTYHTLTILFEGAVKDFDKMTSNIKELNKSIRVEDYSFNNHSIPVRYHTNSSEMKLLSQYLGITVAEIIQLHKVQRYDVHFFGFIPGFMYLGGLNPRLHTSRKKSISPYIKQGSVAIAGHQTGIYPSDSPGGWWIIGEVEGIINVENINPGDTITFIAYD